VNIIHKGVGQISESDILLATASEAIVVGFQVRPSAQARKLAEKEEVEIRMYSIIYDAINEVRDAMEGMLSLQRSKKRSKVLQRFARPLKFRKWVPSQVVWLLTAYHRAQS